MSAGNSEMLVFMFFCYKVDWAQGCSDLCEPEERNPRQRQQVRSRSHLAPKITWYLECKGLEKGVILITCHFRDCTVRVWQLSPGKPLLLKELGGHSELVHYVAIDQVCFPRVSY